MSKLGSIPARWLNCPRKSLDLVEKTFLAVKTVLDERYDDQVQEQHRFSPSMLFSSSYISYKVRIGLWINLTNTDNFYDKKLIEREDGCQYIKLQCGRHGEPPSPEQTQRFIEICRQFVDENPHKIIVVHCTHGYNATGFLIASYLIEVENWSPEGALSLFYQARPPGVYKQNFIQQLFQRYGDERDAPAAPEPPAWCYNEDGYFVEEETNGTSHSKKCNPTFMPGVPGVTPITAQPLLHQIQQRVQEICQWKRQDFPGARPVSMDRENIRFISEMPYKLSWKTNGTCYLMLIDGSNEVYFIDKDNCIFHVENLIFLDRKMPNTHLSKTLLDGEMVIDEVGDRKFPRFLVNDIILYQGIEVGKTNFSTRLICIDKEIIKARSQHIQEGRIDKSSEPFSIRQKYFWALSEARVLLGPKFTKAQLGHQPDGLIFQPSEEPYTPGRNDKLLKWIPNCNSVDFKLQIAQGNRLGMQNQELGMLFVGGLSTPFAQMSVTKTTRHLHDRIIECTWDSVKNQWSFVKERTDKSHPNGFLTAQGVLKSIQEPVTQDMLLNFIDTHEFRRPMSSHLQDGLPPPLKRMKM